MKTLTTAENPVAAATSGPRTRPAIESRALRVLHVVTRLGMGGTEYGILKVIGGLPAESFEHCFCTTRGFDAALVRDLHLEGKIFVAGELQDKFEFLVLPLMRIMKAYKPDIVHSRNWGAIEAILAARLAGVPVAIHSEHGYEVEMLEGLPMRRRVFRRALYAMADAVFTVSNELRTYHAQQVRLPESRIRIIPNGVDTARFFPHADGHLAARQAWEIPAERFVVGTVGRLVPIKDHLTLLRAAEILTARGINVHVVIAGGGPELERLQQRVASSDFLRGRASFPGACEDVPGLLNTFDAFVLPSLCEGMSNTLLEAMSSGVAVVATEVGGNPELVEDAKSGWLFAPGDASTLATRLESLARNPGLLQTIGAAARQRVLVNFSLDRMIRSYRDLYLELAARRGIAVRIAS
jgi:sugar transferase (PEP-CTERM/EpsH1 system associated)